MTAGNPKTVEDRLQHIEGQMLVVEQLVGLLLAKSPEAFASLYESTKRGPAYIRELLQAYPVTDAQIEGATAMLRAAVNYSIASRPQ